MSTSTKPPTPTPPSDWLPEAEVPARLGLSPASAKKLREKAAPAHWRRGKKGRVEWSPALLQAAIAQLVAEPAEQADLLRAASPAPAEKTAADTETLTVTRWQFPNPQVIEAQRANQQRVIVRVKDARHFRPRLHTGAPMTITARRTRGFWHLVGPCPRWPGKW